MDRFTFKGKGVGKQWFGPFSIVLGAVLVLSEQCSTIEKTIWQPGLPPVYIDMDDETGISTDGINSIGDGSSSSSGGGSNGGGGSSGGNGNTGGSSSNGGNGNTGGSSSNGGGSSSGGSSADAINQSSACDCAQPLPTNGIFCSEFVKTWKRSDDATREMTFNEDGSFTSNDYAGATAWKYNENGKGSMRIYSQSGNFIQTFMLEYNQANDRYLLYPSDMTGVIYNGSTPYY